MAEAPGLARILCQETTMESSNIRICEHCGIRYDWRRSPSSHLKMTFCGSLCEKAGLGFSLEAFLRMQRPGAISAVAQAGSTLLAAQGLPASQVSQLPIVRFSQHK